MPFGKKGSYGQELPLHTCLHLVKNGIEDLVQLLVGKPSLGIKILVTISISMISLSSTLYMGYEIWVLQHKYP